jgi:hypothetical protein
VVECDLETFFALVVGELTPAQAVRRGSATVTGERALLARAFSVLSGSQPDRPSQIVPA